ncbi:hypothetical protein DDZ14_02880 [Maritimibacter sp. 55A14]|uniref:AAA family ATPase n=1 Tax=Maritimibacter sp. 55A14 TaxID=2174844 RepID=UPI000D60579A|nr:AAA family ATPase [Maritimibacter sp. 55A14]PWE34115.1 hypothetical protein DDZ14_02880 [Maritimibacter sp. 55A14]
MTVSLRIMGWKAEGFRCPDHEIDCRINSGETAKVTLIQMPNGTGKTTTLSLLRAALSGAAGGTTWNRSRIKEMQKKDGREADGRFELRLSVNDKPMTIIMEFDFDVARVRYKTTWSSGQEDGFNPPFELRRFMNDDFVNFYVFDGELADKLLNSQHTNAETAVESLFQVHLLKRMSDRVSSYWDDQTRNVTAKDEAGYTRRKNLLADWRARHDALVTEQNSLRADLKSSLENLKRQREKYNKEIKKEKERAETLSDAEAALNDFQASVDENAKDLLDTMRNPHALFTGFASSMFELKAGLDRVKLPESAAREFFEELADEDECVCGRGIDEGVRQVIKTKSKQYLGSDDVIFLNAMKSAISDAVGGSRSEAADELTQKVSDMTSLVTDLQSAQNELDEIRREAEESDPDVMKAKEEIDRLSRQCERIEESLSGFEGKDDSVRLDKINKVDPKRIDQIETIEDGIKILEDLVDEARDTQALRRKRDLLKRIIDRAHRKAKETIASEIRDEANEKISALMPNNSIRIERIDRCLVLSGQSGGSVGETLSVGYAFLSTLFDRAEQHQLPFVVDSPANPIDLDIRPNIGALVPNLTGQFIAFVISSEREGFLPSLKKSGGKDIQFITVFRKGASHLETKAIASDGCVTSEDGFRVIDEKFFEEFQLDAEEV